MKSYKLIVLLLIMGLAAAGCETTDPFIQEVRDGIGSGNFDAAIESAERAVETNPENGVAHFYLGLALGSKAENVLDPKDREPVYAKARESFDTAKELMNTQEEKPDELAMVDDAVLQLWGQEHNWGVEILNDDSVYAATPDPTNTAIAHFNNATTMQPDSALSFVVLSSVYFNQNEPQKSIENYEIAISNMDQPTVEDYNFLINLHLREGNLDRAEELSNTAIEIYPEEVSFYQFLADVYLQNNQLDRALSMLQELINSEPDNPQYRRVMGTQIYQTVSKENDELSSYYDQVFDLQRSIRSTSGDEQAAKEQELENLQEKITDKEDKIKELLDRSISEMEKVTELEPSDADAYNILGIMYQNYAASIFEKRNVTEDNEAADQLDELARQNVMLAKENYEKAVEINPDNQEYWQSLFQVYTILGMEEKAREAEQKAGL